MDGLAIALFLSATFFGGVATGLAGFAFGLVVSGVWLHVLTPLQTASLIVGFGLFVQSYGIWRLRRTLNWRPVMPLVIGGAVGAPIGAWLLHYIDPGDLRLGVGILLVAYSSYSLSRTHLRAVPDNIPIEVTVGVLNGVLAGMTGLAGVFVTIWCSMRGWSKDVQRSVYQPVLLAAFVASAVSLTAAGAITVEYGKLFLMGAPALLAGMWLGMHLYGRLNDAAFRKVILVLLLLSGLVLVVPEFIGR